MPTTNQFHLFSTDKVKVPSDRARTEMGSIEALAASLDTLGLLNPITVKRDGTLIAGARRLAAAQSLGWVLIPVHFYEELSPDELILVESEENIRRKDFEWKEECLAIHRYVETRRRLGLPGSLEDCGEASGNPKTFMYQRFAVAEEILVGNPRVLGADSINSAYGLIRRAHERIVDTELSKLDIGGIFRDEGASEEDHTAEVTARITADGIIRVEDVKTYAPISSVRPAELDILLSNFLSWIKSYEGERFNFIHCDFPYGIGLDESDQASADTWTDYEDTPEIFWELTGELLNHRDRIMLSSAHMIFWFPFSNSKGELIYPELLKFFKLRAPELKINPYPLVWHKSDGRGIIPDYQRGPRRTYETALFISRGDRKILSPVANSYSCPTARALGSHPSTKPEPMLGHFFRMVVDDLTDMLDPTCGSGTSLIAAEELGASRVCGLEISPKFWDIAQENLMRARRLRRAGDPK